MAFWWAAGSFALGLLVAIFVLPSSRKLRPDAAGPGPAEVLAIGAETP
jgi:hypothetical protein